VIEFKQILCPIDFSEPSSRALVYATAFATWYEARLVVLHVVPPADETEFGLRLDADVQETRRDEIVAEMHQQIEHAGATALSPTLLTERGRAHERIVQCATSLPADLLVVGTHGRGGFNRLLLGSVTEKILRTTPCPVLTVPPSTSATPTTPVVFKQILCPIDFSPSSLKALRYALELGREADGRVTALYALEYLDPEEPCGHVDFDIRQRRQHFIEHARERLHAQLAGEPKTWCDIEEVVAVNRAYRAILQRAVESNVDLIVMGAQGASGLELMLYGSTAQHVLRAARCPVLTVHA
jgi:nucleotide-binding universal stress UspA family protein